MKNKLYIIVMALVALAFVCLPLIAFGQTNTTTFDANDEAIRDALGKYSLVKVFIVPVVGLIVMALRKFIGKIPDQIWPWITPFIGVGLDYAAARMGFWTGSAEAGAAAGAAAVWFSQLLKQTKEAATDGLSTTPAGKTNEISTPPK